MNYEDELERAKARRSRRRESGREQYDDDYSYGHSGQTGRGQEIHGYEDGYGRPDGRKPGHGGERQAGQQREEDFPHRNNGRPRSADAGYGGGRESAGAGYGGRESAGAGYGGREGADAGYGGGRNGGARQEHARSSGPSVMGDSRPRSRLSSSGYGGGDENRADSQNRRAGSGYSSGAARQTSQDGRWPSKAEPGSRAAMGGKNGNRNNKKKGGKKKIALGIVLGILAVLVALVAGVYIYISGKFNEAQSKNPFNEKEVENTAISLETRQKMEKGYWTVAIFGVDSRDNSTGKGNQSDVIMIANLNRETGEVRLVSVFRDTYLNISDKNTYNKINAAYAVGGPQEAVKALNKNLDLNITSYAAFNWKAVATAINILGGVDIEISNAEFSYINAFITETVKGTGIGSVQLKKPGLHHLDGVQAVAYGRLRLMDTDYARTERQRIVIQKAAEKAKTASLSTLNSLVGNMFAMCSTNIDELDVLRMVKDVKKYHLGETMGFPAARDEKKIRIGGNRSDCVVPATLESNVRDLHKFLFGTEDYEPSSTVKSISKKIAETSGISKEGKAIDHVPTDKGYVPKATTAPKKTTEAETEESSSEDETSEGETLESSPGESSSGIGTLPGDGSSVQISPTYPSYQYPGGYNPAYPAAPPTTGEADRPKSPADMTTAPEASIGPAYEATTPDIPEATTAPMYPTAPSTGPASGATQPAQGGNSSPAANGNVTSPSASSSVIIAPTETLNPGNTMGPAGAP